MTSSGVEDLLEKENRTAVVSRATWFRQAPWATVRAPVVGGQTVWEAVAPLPSQLFVIEQPNWFGRFERLPTRPARTTIVHHWDPDRRDTVGAARHLAAGLRQIREVRVVHGEPESPWFIVSLPVEASEVVTALGAVGFVSCGALGDEFAEFPGGMRIAVAWPRQQNDRFLQVVQATLES